MLTDEEVMKLDDDINMIPLTSDTMGKNIFKKNIELTKVFLKDVARIEEEIYKLEFIDTELEVEKPKNYKFITDLVVLVNDGIIVNIELCRDYYKYHKDRFLAYVCKLFAVDVNKGVNVEDKIKHIKQIIFACKEKTVKNASKHIMLCDVDTKEVVVDKLEIYLHYLEKHYNKYYNEIEVNKEDLWFSLFVSNSLVEQNKILKELVSDDIRNEFIRGVYNMSNDSKMIIDFNAESYNNYVHEKKRREAEIAKEKSIEKAMKKGLKQGLQEGIEKGIEKGIEQGIEQGKIEIALELIKMSMSVQDISKVTGLSIEKIKELEK